MTARVIEIKARPHHQTIRVTVERRKPEPKRLPPGPSIAGFLFVNLMVWCLVVYFAWRSWPW